MRRFVLMLAFGAALAVAGCGGDGSGVEAPPLESPLATAETTVGGGASPSASASLAP